MQYALAVDKVRYAGEAVAAVAAIDRYTAEDAAALIDVEYEHLPVLTDPLEAMKPGAPKVHDNLAEQPRLREDDDLRRRRRRLRLGRIA